MPEGITRRHRRSCSSRSAGSCDCAVTYQAQAFDRVTGKRLTRTFPTEAAAKGWRHDAIAGLRRGSVVVGGTLTLRQAWREWVKAARTGLIRNRSGEPYKPSTLRGYEQAMETRILPDLGAHKITDLRLADLQRLAERLQALGLDASTIRNAIVPMRALYRRLIKLGEAAQNPTKGLELPAVRGRRDRIVAPDVAGELLERLPAVQRALWATALYAGLRHGELRALRWEHLDLAAGLITVQASWDDRAGPVAPKSEAGRRSVPMPPILRDVLVEHRMHQDRGRGLVFGRTPERPFASQTVNDWADAAWSRPKDGRGEWSEPPALRLHEARHSYASYMIAAGVNVKALSEFMGHSSITITLDRYGHLLPGSQEEAAGLLDAFLTRASTAARRAAVT